MNLLNLHMKGGGNCSMSEDVFEELLNVQLKNEISETIKARRNRCQYNGS